MKRTMGLCVIAISAAIILGCSGQVWGQATTQVSGTISDPSGATVPGADVTLINADTNLVRKTNSGPDGGYTFREILPGKYRLEVEAKGFKRVVRSGITLYVNQPATVNMQLEVGAVNQTVEVAAEVPLLNTTDASLGESMGKDEILSLPLEEGNVVDLLSLQPGVVYTTNRKDLNQFNNPNDTRSGAVNGERSDQSNVTLDGVDANDQGSGFAFTAVLPVTMDSIQEFRVSTSNYDAQQGRSAGAEVSLVTTGGTNAFHGDLYEVNRTAFGEANDFFLKSAQEAVGLPNRPQALVHNVFGGSLGGPFIKDRLFFFFNYEGHRFADASSEVRTVPSQSLRDGVVMYQCDPTDPLFSQCSTGNATVTGLSKATYKIPNGYFALSPGQLKKMDPLGIGPNPVTVAYFNTFPNVAKFDPTVGDGVNYVGFRFAAPSFNRDNWYISRIDYKLTSNGNHTLFWRGSAKHDTDVLSAEFLPAGFVLGGIPENVASNATKGFVAGYTALLRPTLVNNFRYGFTRQSVGITGNSNLPWNFIRGISNTGTGNGDGINYSHAYNFPVHNFVDDVSWTKGKHSLGFGANIRLVYNGDNSQLASFSSGTMNASWLTTAGIANTGIALDPAANGFPVVNSSFTNSYDFPLMGLIGMVSEANAQYEFKVNAKTGVGTLFPQGAPVPRHYALYEDELYAQDSWKIKPNLTFNYGLRWLLMTAPWETNGQEVAPSFGLGNWFQQRGVSMRQGVPSNQDPPISFIIAGRSNGRPDLWPNSSKNFAPRVSFAYSPRIGWLKPLFGEGDKSVIRAGFGMYYDHFGQGMLSTLIASGGSFGLAELLTNPAGLEDISTSPRVTNINVVPQFDNTNTRIFILPQTKFPETFPNGLLNGGFCICWGLDSSIKSPYSYALDFTIQRELPGNMSFEAGYVGHLGHRLLMQDDLAMPKDLFDKKNGMDYFTAITTLAKIYRTGVPTDKVTSSTLPTLAPTNGAKAAQYWQDMIQPVSTIPGGAYAIGSSCTSKGGPTSTTDPVQAVYDLFCHFSLNETTPLFILDYFGITNANNPSGAGYFAAGGPNSFFNAQYSSLYAWRSIGFSHYHAAQFTLHKRMSHGVRFDFNYTFSRSIDLASDAERVPQWGGLGGNIINAWSPNQLKAVSDFDLTHQINTNWTLQLPFGQSRHFGSSVGKGLDALIGGWDLSGITRWSSGFPVNISNGFRWATDWQLGGNATPVSQIPTGKTIIKCSCSSNGDFNIFKNPTAALAAFRAPFPGEGGARNVIRGDGFYNTDMNLAKTWKMPYSERHELQFRWDVFNVFNTKRFDVQSAGLDGNLELDISSSFGNYTHVLTNPRVMQFSLRYQF